jgi:hypothetical protein
MSLPPSLRADVTRRQLLVAAGGLTVVALLRPSRVGAADDVAGAAEAARFATLAALLAAVATGPADGMDDAIAAAYVDCYRTYCADADPVFVAYANATLDEVGATGIGGLEPQAALAELVAWGTEGRRAGLAAAALDLTNLTFGEDEARQAGYALSRS